PQRRPAALAERAPCQGWTSPICRHGPRHRIITKHSPTPNVSFSTSRSALSPPPSPQAGQELMKRISPATKMRVLGAIEFAPGKTIKAKIADVSELVFKDEEGQPLQFTWRTIQ